MAQSTATVEPGVEGSGLELSESSEERRGHLVDSTLLGVLLALIAVAVLSNKTVDSWWESALECIIFTVAALRIIGGSLNRIQLVYGDWMILPLLALAVFAVVQTVPFGRAEIVAGINTKTADAISFDPHGTVLFVYKLLALVVIGGLLLRYISSTSKLNVLICLIIVIGVISALIGTVQQRMARDTSGFFSTYLEPNPQFAQFGDRNHFALLMEMTIGLLLGLIIGRGLRRRNLIIGVAALVPLWSAQVFANSRAGVLVMLAQLGFVLVLSFITRSRKDWVSRRDMIEKHLPLTSRRLLVSTLLGLCLLILGTISVIWLGGRPLAQRFEREPLSSELETRTLSPEAKIRRLEMWQSTWQLIKAHPITGVGFGGYWLAIQKYYASSGKKELLQAHNDYLEILASGGIIGASLFAWFFLTFVVVAMKQLRSPDPFRRAACVGALTGIFGVAIHSAFDFGLHIMANAVILVVLIVLATVSLQGKSINTRSNSERLATSV